MKKLLTLMAVVLVAASSAFGQQKLFNATERSKSQTVDTTVNRKCARGLKAETAKAEGLKCEKAAKCEKTAQCDKAVKCEKTAQCDKAEACKKEGKKCDEACKKACAEGKKCDKPCKKACAEGKKCDKPCKKACAEGKKCDKPCQKAEKK